MIQLSLLESSERKKGIAVMKKWGRNRVMKPWKRVMEKTRMKR